MSHDILLSVLDDLLLPGDYGSIGRTIAGRGISRVEVSVTFWSNFRTSGCRATLFHRYLREQRPVKAGRAENSASARHLDVFS
jgi:hypothetical protein